MLKKTLGALCTLPARAARLSVMADIWMGLHAERRNEAVRGFKLRKLGVDDIEIHLPGDVVVGVSPIASGFLLVAHKEGQGVSFPTHEGPAYDYHCPSIDKLVPAILSIAGVENPAGASWE